MTIPRPFKERLLLWVAGWLIVMIKLLCRVGFAERIIDNIAQQVNDPAHQQSIFGDYVPTKHDVFLPIYAKSGTNWMLQIAQQIAYYGEAEFAHIHDLVSWPDFPLPTSVPFTDPTPQQKAPTGLRVIKSHLASEYVPYSADATYILVIRDPKETFVSGYRFGMGYVQANEMPAVDMMLARYLSENYVYGDWAKHTHSYWGWRDRDNVLVLTYNALKADPAAGIAKVAQVMGVSLTPAQLATVVAKSDIGYMKQLGTAFSSPLPRIPIWGAAGTTDLIRRGKSGGSSELLTQAQQNAIDDHMREKLRLLGSDFPYDDLFVTNRSGTQ